MRQAWRGSARRDLARHGEAWLGVTRQVSFVEASGGKVLTGMARQARSGMSLYGCQGDARKSVARHGRAGQARIGLFRFGAIWQVAFS